MDVKVGQLFFFLLGVLHVSLAARKAQVAIVDAILAEIFLTGYTLYELVRFDFCPARMAVRLHDGHLPFVVFSHGVTAFAHDG